MSSLCRCGSQLATGCGVNEIPAKQKPRRRLIILGVIIATCALILDQLTKYWILYDVMQPPRVIEVTPFFNIVLAWNRGVSFGMFNEASTYGPHLLTALALVIVVALSVWLYKAETRFTALALGLIIGGALGNVIDRVQFGAVVDFLDFHAMGYRWPAFNVSDASICIGAAMLVLESLFQPGKTS